MQLVVAPSRVRWLQCPAVESHSLFNFSRNNGKKMVHVRAKVKKNWLRFGACGVEDGAHCFVELMCLENTPISIIATQELTVFGARSNCDVPIISSDFRIERGERISFSPKPTYLLALEIPVNTDCFSTTEKCYFVHYSSHPPLG